MYSLGCDPGAHGALCVLDMDGKIVWLEDMPVVKVKVGTSERDRVSAPLLVKALQPWKGWLDKAVLEKVGGMTGQSASAAFTFGYGCGMVEGVFAAMEFPVVLVTPQKWKKSMALGPDKGLARQMAMRLWPENADTFKRVKDDGRAEAALLAQWGKVNR